MDDFYLSYLAEVYQSGNLSLDELRRMLNVYAEGNKISSEAIEEFIKRLTMKKEYTIDEKRRFLAAIRLDDGKELKYGEMVYTVPDDMVEKCYAEEEKNLDASKFAEYHDLAEFKYKQEIARENVEDWYKPYESEVEEIKPIQDENKENDEISIEQLDKVEGGISFEAAIERIKASGIPIQDLKEPKEDEPTQQVNEETSEPIVDTTEDEDIIDEPETEEDYERTAKNVTKPEKDSNVRQVEASPERIAKLKKGKRKALNFFLKTAIAVTALTLMHPIESIPLIGGYLYFASEIKNGKFVPKNNFQELIKKAVEKVMYIGMSKDAIEEERGKTR